MNEITKKLLLRGIRLKMYKGQLLEDILSSYTKLTEDEKQELRDSL